MLVKLDRDFYLPESRIEAIVKFRMPGKRNTPYPHAKAIYEAAKKKGRVIRTTGKKPSRSLIMVNFENYEVIVSSSNPELLLKNLRKAREKRAL